MNRTIVRTALASLSLAAAACGAAPSDGAASSQEEVTLAAPFGGAGYYQIDSAQPSAGEITILSLATNRSYWAQRCKDDACIDMDAFSGTYKYTRTKLRFYDANGALVGAWSYALAGGSLWLRRTDSWDVYALDPMSEDLCDASGGAWSDDELAAHGFNCACPDGQDWGPGGCQGCPNGSCAKDACSDPALTRCGTACVDTSSDTSNCGACNSACTKAQRCVGGACQ